ncbi:MAG: DUF4159 domain-containing protein [Steroidobacteraceae bacterium]
MLRRRKLLLSVVTLGLLVVSAAWAAREFRVYRSFEEQADYTELPKDWNEPAGFVVARLMYPSGGRGGFGGFGGFRGGNWRNGGTYWAVDYPRGDRYYASILRRLTTIDVRSVEQPVNLEDGDDVFDWPYLIVGLAGFWDLDDMMVDKLRDYLLRGGFLLVDSFWGTGQWQGFMEGMSRIFPDRPVVDLPDDHALFHSVYNVSTKGQVPNMNSLMGGGGGYQGDGDTPHWRGVLDDSNRVMVAIAFNNDMSDAFQWADDPDYPAEGAALGVRMGVNFAVYALTH